jgi:hypothetical protein
MSIHVPLPIPTHLDDVSPPALSEKEQTLYDTVLEHFSVADYTLPSVDQEKAALVVDEKYWLVSAPPQFRCDWLTSVILTNSHMNVC